MLQVKGRSLQGNVYMGKNAPPIDGAQVTLDQSLQTRTNANGYFIFDNVKFGEHFITVNAGKISFNKNLRYFDLFHSLFKNVLSLAFPKTFIQSDVFLQCVLKHAWVV